MTPSSDWRLRRLLAAALLAAVCAGLGYQILAPVSPRAGIAVALMLGGLTLLWADEMLP